MRRLIVQSCIVLALVTASSAADSQILLQDRFERAGANGVPEGWSVWQANAAYPLTVQRVQQGDRGWRIRMAGAGSRFAKARAFRPITGLQGGEWYKFEAVFTATNIPNPADCAVAVLEHKERHTRVLTPVRSGDDYISTLVMQMPEGYSGPANIHLFAGYIPGGTVEWKEVRVERLSSYKPPTRPVRVSAIDSEPPQPGSVEDNARHYAAEIDRACAGGKLDLIVFPEHMNTTKVTGKTAVSLDSRYMQILGEAARRNRTYLAGSIHEERDGVIYNTGFVIDREGKVAGRYEKTHLTVGEMLFSPLIRGEETKVFQTDFGKIALMVCFDFHYPEAPRLAAQMGAEIILVPFASDGRLKEDGYARGAEYSGRAFALENRIPIIFSATLGKDEQPSWIIDQSAKVLARSGSQKHIIRATLDLDAKVIQAWTGEDFHGLQIVGRRPELYNGLGVR